MYYAVNYRDMQNGAYGLILYNDEKEASNIKQLLMNYAKDESISEEDYIMLINEKFEAAQKIIDDFAYCSPFSLLELPRCVEFEFENKNYNITIVNPELAVDIY